jgi:probable HAF family extracellular repeat protein
VIIGLSPIQTASAAEFFGLGPEASTLQSVANDGATIVGVGNKSGQSMPFRWTAENGSEWLGALPERNPLIHTAVIVSEDGSAVEGRYFNTVTTEQKSYRWTAATGIVPYDPPWATTVLFGDGSEGLAPGQGPIRWSLATGAEPLDASKTNLSTPHDASADHKTVVGSAYQLTGDGFEAFRWTEADGMVSLGDLPGGKFSSEALAISADGRVIVGVSSSDDLGEAFRWTSETGMVSLEPNPQAPESNGLATDVSGDGAFVVGRSRNFGAFLWDAEHGMRSLQDVLVNEYGLGTVLTGWTLTDASFISDDGTTLVGNGRRLRDGVERSEVWVAKIPEPQTLTLALLGVLAIAPRFWCRLRGKQTRQ